MLRKIGFLTLMAAAGLFILSQTRVGSYGGTAWKKVRNATKNQIPIEFEIERLRHEVAQLQPDMKNQLSGIAEEMVAVQNLREEIDSTKTSLSKQKEILRAMADDLKRGITPVSYSTGRPYSATYAREKLDRDLAGCKRCEQEVKNKEQLLEAKERALDAARERLASVKGQQKDLEVAIAGLEADLRTVRLAQTRSKFEFDDSRLAHIKQSLADLKTRLQVEKKTSELYGDFANDAAPASEPKAKSSDQVIHDVEAYLGDNSQEDGKVAQGKK